MRYNTLKSGLVTAVLVNFVMSQMLRMNINRIDW